MAEEKIELSAPVKELLDEVDALYPLGMVHVDFTGDKSGFVQTSGEETNVIKLIRETARDVKGVSTTH